MRSNPVNLAAEIFQLMKSHDADRREGTSAIMSALLISLITDGCNKQAGCEWFDRAWDNMEKRMTATTKREFDATKQREFDA
jgi:hypothetical protein